MLVQQKHENKRFKGWHQRKYEHRSVSARPACLGDLRCSIQPRLKATNTQAQSAQAPAPGAWSRQRGALPTSPRPLRAPGVPCLSAELCCRWSHGQGFPAWWPWASPPSARGRVWEEPGIWSLQARACIWPWSSPLRGLESPPATPSLSSLLHS